MPICPVCGEECNDFYVSYYANEIVGCEHCIYRDSAWERSDRDRFDERIDYEYEREG